MYDFAFFLAVLASLFALVDPIGALPFYVGLTEGFSPADRRIVILRAITVLGVVLAAFALFGRFVFAIFGFTLAAFEIAGGILLFVVAYEMLMGELTRTKLTSTDQSEALKRRDELAVVPLGIPLLAGPGAISTVMIYVGNAGSDLLSIVSIFVAVAIVTAVTYVVLRYGELILRRIGRVGIMAITRVLGLLLAAVGVQFVITGILAAFALH